MNKKWKSLHSCVILYRDLFLKMEIVYFVVAVVAKNWYFFTQLCSDFQFFFMDLFFSLFCNKKLLPILNNNLNILGNRWHLLLISLKMMWMLIAIMTDWWNLGFLLQVIFKLKIAKTMCFQINKTNSYSCRTTIFGEFISKEWCRFQWPKVWRSNSTHLGCNKR